MSIFDTTFNTTSQHDFIKDYWQQQPLVFTQSFTSAINCFEGSELAGLACEPDVESRIISGNKIDGDWQCQQSPLTENDFASLPDHNWTLLVQGVDQWDDEISAILNHFDFLPKWRLEDIMASYAPIGGSVGPHFDYYDVFLIQVSGSREWQIGQTCDHNSALQDNNQVKLLAEFDCKDKHIVNAGDMIYVPAGVAHWGTSLSDDCITLSVGFRAPSENEIVIEALEGLVEHFSKETPNSSLRFQDTQESIDDHPHKINQHAQAQLSNAVSLVTPELVQQAINQAFGQLVTDPRYSPFDDEDEKKWTEEELIKIFKTDSELTLTHSSNSRFAFSQSQLFVNGEAYSVDKKFARDLCDKKTHEPESKEQMDVLLSLLNHRYIDINTQT